ncbi:MAG: hypothetical protein AAGA54_23060 [Myxococcota bacterium]
MSPSLHPIGPLELSAPLLVVSPPSVADALVGSVADALVGSVADALVGSVADALVGSVADALVGFVAVGSVVPVVDALLVVDAVELTVETALPVLATPLDPPSVSDASGPT